jgi:hypothetical protein
VDVGPALVTDGEVCGRDFDTILRWRQRTGRRALQTRFPTCGRPRCRRAYQDSLRDGRLQHHRRRYERARKQLRWPEPPPGPWRCAVCGCGVKDALELRRKRGLRVFHTMNFRTCGSPECRRAWRLGYSGALWGAPTRVKQRTPDGGDR